MNARTVTLPSRTAGHADHHVTITTSRRAGVAGPAGTLYVTCDCSGGRNAFANAALGRNSACYAMRTIGTMYTAFVPGVTRR